MRITTLSCTPGRRAGGQVPVAETDSVATSQGISDDVPDADSVVVEQAAYVDVAEEGDEHKTPVSGSTAWVSSGRSSKGKFCKYSDQKSGISENGKVILTLAIDICMSNDRLSHNFAHAYAVPSLWGESHRSTDQSPTTQVACPRPLRRCVA